MQKDSGFTERLVLDLLSIAVMTNLEDLYTGF